MRVPVYPLVQSLSPENTPYELTKDTPRPSLDPLTFQIDPLGSKTDASEEVEVTPPDP